MTEQERLNKEATEQAIRVGRQMSMITDALFNGWKPAANRSSFPEGWDRDDTKEGMFVTHSCSRCSHGAKPCPNGQTGSHRNCEHPHARND